MKKLYVLVRNDILNKSQIAVQGGHAVAEFILKHPWTEWDNGTLVYLGIKNENQMIRYCIRLSLSDIDYSEFREPDLNNQITAVAALSDGEEFKQLNLI